jgi:cysteine synthase A
MSDQDPNTPKKVEYNQDGTLKEEKAKTGPSIEVNPFIEIDMSKRDVQKEAMSEVLHDGNLVDAAQCRGMIYDNILDTIGGTPLVRVPNFVAKYGLEADILTKLEFFNPLASVKDRLALAMVTAAEKGGKITPGKTTLVEPTSGNTGIGLAFVAAVKGYKIILTMPESMSMERQKMLKFYGAELILTPSEKGMRGAIEKAQDIVKEMEDAYMPGQFDNPANAQMHRETTAEEIWTDTKGNVDILVAGVGTGGTITGISQVLKQRNPNFKTYAVEPEDSAVLSGEDPGPHKIQGIGAGFSPAVLDEKMIDGIIKVGNQKAFDMAREVAQSDGIPCGISSGAAMAAAIEVAQMPENKGKTIVVMLASFAERYISTDLFADL